jgi:ketosteroid isomerase-like protein
MTFEYRRSDLENICSSVAKLCFVVFPHIPKRQLRSSNISCLFETQAARYYSSQGINVVSTHVDKDPDLYFADEKISCEIKVTGVKSAQLCRPILWLGGKYSKRSSDHIFVAWNYNETTLYGQSISFSVVKTYVDQEEWTKVSNSEYYYGLGFKSSLFENREYQVLVGDYENGCFKLKDFHE